MRLKKINDRLSVKKMLGMLLIIFSCLLAAGCSEEGTAEDNGPPEASGSADKNAETIQTVIEKEFNGPDKKYKELWEAAMAAQKADMSQEEYDALMETPVYTELASYAEETYASYFTANGYENFLNAAPAFMYSIFDGDYDLSTSDVKISQNEVEPTLYSFTFQVVYENGEKETSKHNFEGEAIVPEEGKIGKIQFHDKDSLLQEMNEQDNSVYEEKS